MKSFQPLYRPEDVEVLRPAVESRVATDREASDEAARTNGERLRDIARTRLTPERLAIAQEALTAGGYEPIEVGDDFTLWIAVAPPRRRTGFALLTLLSGGRQVAVNPRHVAQVFVDASHMHTTYTSVELVNGEILQVEGSIGDVVAQLEAVAA